MSAARRLKKIEKRDMARRAADAIMHHVFETTIAPLYRRLLVEGSVEFDVHLPRDPAQRRAFLEQLQFVGAD